MVPSKNVLGKRVNLVFEIEGSDVYLVTEVWREEGFDIQRHRLFTLAEDPGQSGFRERIEQHLLAFIEACDLPEGIN